MRRLSILKDSQISHAREAFRLLNDKDKGIFSDLYGSWAGTIHTSGYFPKDLKAWFALGGNREPVTIDFARWLSGEEVNMKRMTGEIETDIPFVHMDKNADWFR